MAVLFCSSASVSVAETGASRSIGAAVFLDKVRGGWAGQMIGVTYGAPTEFHSLQRINDDPRDWKPEELAGALDQDDLYVEMTFADVIDRVGIDATSDDYGAAFKSSKYQLWHANLAARRALQRGVPGSLSGDPRYNLHVNDIDFQIESDFIGLMTPGMPRVAQQIADRVGHVMNYGDGVYGGMFISAMYSSAYFENDPREVVEVGLAAIPPGSAYAKTIADILRWSSENPSDWRKTWALLEAKWDHDDPCPDGALRPLNINASLNGAYVALALLYGHRDFERTMEIATRSGQDSDCNPSSAAGILGAMIGYKAIPARWTDPLPAIADRKFSYTNDSFNTSVGKTIRRAHNVVLQQGGRVERDRLIVPLQRSAVPKLEQFDPGTAVERIGPDDHRWRFAGAWTKAGKTEEPSRAADSAGSEAVVTFRGTGAILTGVLRQEGGRYDVYLDGSKVGALDSYTTDGDRYRDGLWGKFDLVAGNHELRVVVKGQPFNRRAHGSIWST